MIRLLIIGYGNPLRRDDGFGWYAAERLREIVEAEILTVQQLTPELMDPISQAERVVFIDASAALEPGELKIAPVEPAAQSRTAFTHFSTPPALLAGAAALYGGRPSALLVTAGGEDFGIGEGLSAPVQAALETLVAKLRWGML